MNTGRPDFWKESVNAEQRKQGSIRARMSAVYINQHTACDLGVFPWGTCRGQRFRLERFISVLWWDWRVHVDIWFQTFALCHLQHVREIKTRCSTRCGHNWFKSLTVTDSHPFFFFVLSFFLWNPRVSQKVQSDVLKRSVSLSCLCRVFSRVTFYYSIVFLNLQTTINNLKTGLCPTFLNKYLLKSKRPDLSPKQRRSRSWPGKKDDP